MTKLEQAFTLALLEQLRMAAEVTGVEETRLKRAAEEKGGVLAVKQLLARGQTTRQFAPLQSCGRLDLSPEALVIQGKYGALFTDEEANLCLSLLLEGGMFS